MDQVPQIGGAVLVLAAFAALQRGSLAPHSRLYLWLNVLGAGVLTGVALHQRDWGFFMLEAVWTLVSAWSLAQLARGRELGEGPGKAAG